MSYLTNANAKNILCLIIGISLLFTESVFAQFFDGDEETQSWVIDMWSPTNDSMNSVTNDNEALSWDIGSALGIEKETPPVQTATSGGSSGSGGGGRLGTANYSLKNRSTLVTMERQMMVAQQQQKEKKEFDPKYTIVDLPESDTQNTIVKDTNLPLDIVDHVLVAEAGRDDLVTPYESPVSQTNTRQPERNNSGSQVVRSSAPKQTTLTRNFSSQRGSILVSSDPFPIQKTHLLSWNEMDKDIAEYKLNVIKKIILNALIMTGKILFFSGIVGLIIALLFRNKIRIFQRNKVRQLTLFSLLK
jgi:hypothetical protein